MVKKYELSIFLLEHKLNKEMWLKNPFGLARAHFGIGQVIILLGNVFLNPPLLFKFLFGYNIQWL